MREDHWRVHKCEVERLDVSAGSVKFWGVFPPGWPLDDLQPLLMFPVWRQAYRAASARADFAASPPVQARPDDREGG